MTTRILVVTTVHHPDDTRIREKLIPTLAGNAEVAYACAVPGPTDRSELRWLRLPGGRLRRDLAAWWLGLRERYEVLSLHDPELLPLGIAVAWLRRCRVVFDVHEHIPDQIRMRTWIPRIFRPGLAWVGVALLRLAERSHHITLAEPGYGELFKATHPVIPNYLLADTLHPVANERDDEAIYLGDVTAERGIAEAIEAARRADIELTIVGRVASGFEAEFGRLVAGGGVEVVGRLPHHQAMTRLGRARVAISPLRDLPNYRRSLPTKVLEYLAMGVPVVATDLLGTRDVLEGLESVWLVPPGDVEAMADAISAARAPAALEAAIRQAPDVRARFTWPVDTVLSVYLP